MVGASSSDDKIINLDLGNPLHLQTSDFNSNTIISVKLTGTENYRVWTAAMKLAINWERCNSIVLSWLLNSVSEELFLGQIFSDNTSEFLMGLNDVFQPIRSSLLARETLPDVKDAFAIISSREESHRGITSDTNRGLKSDESICNIDNLFNKSSWDVDDFLITDNPSMILG
ncbi:hypothetical protein Tco_0767880 [Tanacetum coccineum]